MRGRNSWRELNANSTTGLPLGWGVFVGLVPDHACSKPPAAFRLLSVIMSVIGQYFILTPGAPDTKKRKCPWSKPGASLTLCLLMLPSVEPAPPLGE